MEVFLIGILVAVVKLTDMADIDDGECDFDSDPALGGPEEPMAAGSNVAVPEVVDDYRVVTGFVQHDHGV